MTARQHEKEKGLVQALITAFEDQKEVPSKADVEARAALLAPVSYTHLTLPTILLV